MIYLTEWHEFVEITWLCRKSTLTINALILKLLFDILT